MHTMQKESTHKRTKSANINKGKTPTSKVTSAEKNAYGSKGRFSFCNDKIANDRVLKTHNYATVAVNDNHVFRDLSHDLNESRS